MVEELGQAARFLAVFLLALALELVWLSALSYGIYLLIRLTV